MNLLKKAYNVLFKSKTNRRVIKNDTTKVSYNELNVVIISMPNLKNKSFKIANWFCKVGEVVNKGDILCELENELNTIEFESYKSGRLVEITTKKGFIYKDELICKIEKF